MQNAENTAHDSVVVRKPAATTHFANKYSIQERKLLNVCLWNAQNQGYQRSVHEMDCTLVRELIGATETRNYEWLRELARGLVGTLIEWNSLGKDKTAEWTVCTLLSSGQIRGGKFRYRLNPEIVDQIRNPRLWGKFKLLAQIKLKRKHALIIYEFLSTELSIQGASAQEIKVRISVDDIREICGLTEGQYEKFKDFNKYVLLPAKQEIDKFTEIVIDYECLRDGRKINELIFNVQRKKHFQFSLPGFDELPVKNLSAENATEESVELLALLTAHDVSKSQAMRLVGKYSAERIRRNLAYYEKQAQKTKVDNRAAYVVKAIEGDFQPGPTAADITASGKAQTTARQLAAAVGAKAKATEDKAELKAFEDFQYARAREIFAGRSTSWQQKRRKAFQDNLPEGNALVRERLARGEWDSPIVSSVFFGELKNELLTEPHETSVEKYRAWKNNQAA